MMLKSESPEITLITPMFNEEAEIEDNIKRILIIMEKLGKDWEYILIDDGSTDASHDIALEEIRKHPRCRILHYPRNQGRGYALRKGFDAARGKYIITTESDLSWGLNIIGELYNKLISSKSDVVVASVFHEGGGFRNVPTFRRLLSKGGNWIMSWCFETNLTQFSGMTRGYRNKAIKSIHLEETGKEIHLEIISKSEALGFCISEIPAKIQWSEKRAEGRLGKKLSVLRYVVPHLLNSLNQGSLKIFLFLSFLLFSVGVGLTTFGTINKFFFVTEQPKPNIVNYGLILILTSIVCAFFAGISLQLTYLRKSLVQIQSQIKVLVRSENHDLDKVSISRGDEGF